MDIVGPQLGQSRTAGAHRPDAGRQGRVHASSRSSSQLSTGLLGAVATEFRRGDRLIDLRVRYPDRYRFDPAWVRNFPLTTAAGGSCRCRPPPRSRSLEGESELYREDLKQMLPITGRPRGSRPGERDRRRQTDARWRDRVCRSATRTRSAACTRASSGRSARCWSSLRWRCCSSSALLVGAVPPLHGGPRDPVGGAAVARRRVRAAARHAHAAQRVVVHGADPAGRPDRQERDHPGRPCRHALSSAASTRLEALVAGGRGPAPARS